ncbi:ORF6N domain-containing protein [Sphingobacterium sp. PCS056]|uniref:ORF6N domain-containing protein n=1 Tax=Sphingobacterium sp. PCS056 TaxID=2931400 RepID=UPI00200F170F|nr:ORF6N domain-containing protein [Sphingobacterium sp. PCS056]UPZ37863.1 ORF6N domain-containing protein [Sphingobacterium sp. PCS056]
MAKQETLSILPEEVVMNKIYVFRGHKVMLDSDLAALYGIETKVLKQAVRRNITRFPDDFMFELLENEFELLRSQIVTSKTDNRGGSRYLPMMFTEQGVAMLSSVLKSDIAIKINIQIMRVFTRMRQLLTDNTDLRLEIAEIKNAVEKISRKQDGQDKNMELVFEYIDRLQDKIEEPIPKERKKIGFDVGDKQE